MQPFSSGIITHERGKSESRKKQNCDASKQKDATGNIDPNKEEIQILLYPISYPNHYQITDI